MGKNIPDTKIKGTVMKRTITWASNSDFPTVEVIKARPIKGVAVKISKSKTVQTDPAIGILNSLSPTTRIKMPAIAARIMYAIYLLTRTTQRGVVELFILSKLPDTLSLTTPIEAKVRQKNIIPKEMTPGKR